jgi:hypothetical protein
MPTTPFLDVLQFDAGTQRVIIYAFGMTCMALRVKTTDPIAEQVAERIIKSAKDGERDPVRLCDDALDDVRS